MPSFTEVNSSVYAQLLRPIIISHHTPTYLVGLIHDVSASLHGSLRFSVMRDAKMSAPVLPTITVRHGDTHGVCIKPLSPRASGVSHDSKVAVAAS